MPFDRGPCLPRPRRPVRRLGLEDPFAHQRLEPLERLPCGWLVHRVAPPSDCSRNLISTRYPHVIGLVWHHTSLRPLSLYGSETVYCAASCMWTSIRRHCLSRPTLRCLRAGEVDFGSGTDQGGNHDRSASHAPLAN